MEQFRKVIVVVALTACGGHEPPTVARPAATVVREPVAPPRVAQPPAAPVEPLVEEVAPPDPISNAPRKYWKLDGVQPYESIGLGFAADHALYIGGTFSGKLTIDRTSVKSTRKDGYLQVFLARIGADGKVDWIKVVGGSLPGDLHAIAVAPDGSVAALGMYTTVLGSGQKRRSKEEAFVTVFGPDGKSRWEQRLTSDDRTWAAHAAFDRDGSLLVCGSFAGTASFGARSLTSAPGPHVLSVDMFAARYSPDGKLAWVVRAGGVDDDRAELVTTTLAGDVIVAGNVGRGATFGDAPHAITLAGPDKSEIANPDRVFVASYTADGQVRWAYQYGQRDLGRVIAVASLPDSSILIHGADEEIAGQGPRRVRSFLVQLDPGGRQLQDRTVEDATSFAFDGTLVSARRDASSLVFERHTVQRTASLAASLALPRQPFRVFALARGDDGRIALGAQAGEETQKELPNRRIETSYASVDVFIALAPTADQLPLRP